MAPKYRSLATALQGVVNVGAVNCEEHSALCKGMGVQGYPTIRAFVNSKAHKYNGDRSAADLKRWALKLVPNRVKVVGKGRDGLTKALAACGAAKWRVCIVLFTDKTETSAMYKALSGQFDDQVVFLEVRDTGLAAMLGMDALPALAAVCNGDLDHGLERYEGQVKATSIRRWVGQYGGGKKCLAAMKLDEGSDLGALRVSQLKDLLEARGVTCRDCLEKGDYIKRLRQVVAGGHSEL